MLQWLYGVGDMLQWLYGVGDMLQWLYGGGDMLRRLRRRQFKYSHLQSGYVYQS